jgi:hypothetical protein
VPKSIGLVAVWDDIFLERSAKPTLDRIELAIARYFAIDRHGEGCRLSLQLGDVDQLSSLLGHSFEGLLSADRFHDAVAIVDVDSCGVTSLDWMDFITHLKRIYKLVIGVSISWSEFSDFDPEFYCEPYSTSRTTWQTLAQDQADKVIEHLQRGAHLIHPMATFKKYFPVEDVELTCEKLEVKAGEKGKEYIEARIPLSEVTIETEDRSFSFQCTGPYEDCIAGYASERAPFPPNAQYPKLKFFEKDYEFGEYVIRLKNERVAELLLRDLSSFQNSCKARK